MGLSSAGLGTFGPASGAAKVSLQELLTDPNATSQVWENMRKNAATGTVALLGIPIGFRIAKRVARKPINTSNRMLKDIGINTPGGVKL